MGRIDSGVEAFNAAGSVKVTVELFGLALWAFHSFYTSLASGNAVEIYTNNIPLQRQDYITLSPAILTAPR